MIRVSSSAIAAIGYEPATGRMRIRFVGGHAYDFRGVPARVHQAFLHAGSKGRCYNDRVRDRYPC